MCTWVHVWRCTRVHVYTCRRGHARMRTRRYAHLWTRARAHVHMWAWLHVYVGACVHVRVHTCARCNMGTCVDVYLAACVFVHGCACARVRVCACVHVYMGVSWCDMGTRAHVYLGHPRRCTRVRMSTGIPGYARMYVYTRAKTRKPRMPGCTRVHECTCASVHVWMCTCLLYTSDAADE